MKKSRLIALLTTVAMLISVIPSAAEEAPYVTRQYVIAQFVEAVGEESFENPPADLSAYEDADEIGSEQADSMALAVGNGLIKGYEDNTLRPENTITRLEALIILGRCLTDVEEKRPSAEFSDVPDWAAGEIDRLYRGEIVNGYGNGLLGSDDNITAEQVALFVQRITAEEVSAAPSLKDDFYTAVNYDFLSSAVIPENGLSVSVLDDIYACVNDRLNEISREIVEKYDTQGESSFSSVEEEAAKLYKLALEAYNGGNDISPLRPLLNYIAMCETPAELGKLGGEYIRDYRMPILFDVVVPYKKTAGGQQRNLGGTYISYVGSGMDRSFWEDGGSEARENYVAYLEKILTLLDFADARALAEAAADMQIEIDMAGKSYAEQVRVGLDDDETTDEDYFFTYNQLDSRYGYTKNPVTATVLELTKPRDNALSATLQRNWDDLVISDINKVDKAVELIFAADIKTLRAICSVNLVEGFMSFMPKAYRDASAEFNRYVMGGGESETAEDYATDIASWIYGEYYEMKYLEKYGDFDSEQIEDLITEISGCFEEKFRRSAIMSPATSVKAISKLNKMGRSVGEAADDYDEDENYYIVPKNKSLLAVALELYSRYGGTYYSAYTCVNSTPPCYTVNASYNRYVNSFNIYAGILNDPLYLSGQSEEELLAGIGFTIAHEISHAFDESGSLYDSNGDYSQWWQDSDYEVFSKNTAALAEIYSGHKTAAGNSINGKTTSDENIADIIAMDCIITIAEKKGLDMDALFRAYAKTWAEVKTAEYDAYCAKYDVHSDGKTRVNAVLSNFDEFYETYGIEEGDGMYVAPENRIKFI